MNEDNHEFVRQPPEQILETVREVCGLEHGGEYCRCSWVLEGMRMGVMLVSEEWHAVSLDDILDRIKAARTAQE